ncbi:PucR family transcriptional regulator [Jatrophihabitans fulvus]
MPAEVHDAAAAPPRVDTARLVDTLAPLLVVEHDGGGPRVVRGVVVHDATEPLVASEGDVVLAVGAPDADSLADLLARAHAADCAAVVLKAHVVAVTDAPLPVLRLARDAVWLHVAELVRSFVTAASHTDGGLFELADAIAAVVDGPVTIEDVHSNVLAFSRRQDEADEGRIATVLGRRVPARYLKVLQQQGVFAALRNSDEPVFVGPVEDGLVPRVAVAVRAGDELLGSVWAAVRSEPDAAQARALRDAARVVALHLLRRRVGADVTRRLQADQLATLLAGGPRAADAADRLQLRAGAMRVVACRFHDLADRPEAETGLDGLRDVIAFHFGVLHPHAATALVGGVVYAVVPGRTLAGDDRLRTAASALVAQIGARHDLVVALSSVTESFTGLPACRAEADRVLRALGVLRLRTGQRLAAPENVRLETLLLRVSDAMRADGDAGLSDDAPLAALQAYDAEHHTDLVGTLAAYLAAMGNVKTAAERLTVHQNTLRYRLQRIRAVSGLDLDDADARLTAMLLLRMRSLTDGG